MRLRIRLKGILWSRKRSLLTRETKTYIKVEGNNYIRLVITGGLLIKMVASLLVIKVKREKIVLSEDKELDL